MKPLDEGQLTRMRRETKATLEPAEAMRLCAFLEERFNLRNVVETAITSIYLDHADGRLAQATLEDPTHCLKVRIKEYDPDYGATGGPRCVVELKRNRGQVVRKRRFWVPRAAIPLLFAEGTERLSGFGREVLGARAALEYAGGAASLRPRVTVTYRRRVYQLDEAMRVTVDRDLAFHAAPPELLLGPLPPSAAQLCTPFSRESRVVVEVKHIAATLPEWLAPLMGLAPAATFSKFGAAVAQLSHREAQLGAGTALYAPA